MAKEATIFTDYDWQIKIPIPDGHVWVLTNSYGRDPDDAFESVVRRFPNALAVKPKGSDGDKLVNPIRKVVCAVADSPILNGFCKLCGQNTSLHPVLEGTKPGDAAVAWQRYLDGMDVGEHGWCG